jgi:hypothetical protein
MEENRAHVQHDYFSSETIQGGRGERPIEWREMGGVRERKAEGGTLKNERAGS